MFVEEHLFLQKDIKIQNSFIMEVADSIDPTDREDIIDATGYMVIPGLVDIHLHGACMQDTCDGTVQAIKKIAEYEASKGILAICPTTMTMSENQLEMIAESFRNFVQEGQTNQEASVLGMRLEGPFLSEKKAGAQRKEWIQNPSICLVEALQTKSGNQIKIIDIAPELEGAASFVKETKENYVISMAHTDADYDQAKSIFGYGVSHVTHLFNAMNGLHHRNPGPIVAAKEEGASVELICDGIHVHPAVIRLCFDLFEEEKIVLISDSMRACGMPDGCYSLGGQEVIVKGKKATLSASNDTIAGSVTNLYECMCQAISFGVKPERAIASASYNPAKVLGVEKSYGVIKKEAYANLLIVDEKFNIHKIICKGKILE